MDQMFTAQEAINLGLFPCKKTSLYVCSTFEGAPQQRYQWRAVEMVRDGKKHYAQRNIRVWSFADLQTLAGLMANKSGRIRARLARTSEAAATEQPELPTVADLVPMVLEAQGEPPTAQENLQKALSNLLRAIDWAVAATHYMQDADHAAVARAEAAEARALAAEAKLAQAKKAINGEG